MTGAPAVAVVGVHGHGHTHVRHVLRLAGKGAARLAAVVDPRPVDDLAYVPPGTRWVPALDDLLVGPERPDVVVLATPIHTHLPLARAALRAGCDVLLEKPTTASLAEHAELVAFVEETGRRCQVGFQSFGSAAVDELERLVASGALGEVRVVGAVGTWVRTAAYYARARWAGKRRLDGVDVVDGVVTNPLAHAVATALRVAGARTAADVLDVRLDQFHAHPIEADDTSSLVVRTAGGVTVGAGLTLAAAERTPARVVVRGTAGEATLLYEHDELEVHTRTQSWRRTFARVDLLDDLLAARVDPSARLRCDVASTGAFMRVLEAVRLAPDPRQVPAAHLRWRGVGQDRHPVVGSIAAWCERAALEPATFTELGAPFALAAAQAEPAAVTAPLARP